jgi:hypothetical protein
MTKIVAIAYKIETGCWTLASGMLLSAVVLAYTLLVA